MTFSLVKMDGIVYNVRVTYDSLHLHFALVEGDNAATMLNDYDFRDLQGTKYGHEMQVEPDPAHPEDYDAFFYAISAPVPTHLVELPFGQSTITYEAKVTDGDITFGGKLAGKNRWKGLVVRFSAIQPQRR